MTRTAGERLTWLRVMDIAEVTGVSNVSNRIASGLGWAPNPEYETLGR